jgi:hypothetical protein
MDSALAYRRTHSGRSLFALRWMEPQSPAIRATLDLTQSRNRELADTSDT